jgi:hypothetical protein
MSWSDLTVAYLLIGGLVIGLPVVFFVVTFLPGLMRTTGESIGVKQESPTQEGRPSRPVAARSMGAALGPRGTKAWPGRNLANTP